MYTRVLELLLRMVLAQVFLVCSAAWVQAWLRATLILCISTDAVIRPWQAAMLSSLQIKRNLAYRLRAKARRRLSCCSCTAFIFEVSIYTLCSILSCCCCISCSSACISTLGSVSAFISSSSLKSDPICAPPLLAFVSSCELAFFPPEEEQSDSEYCWRNVLRWICFSSFL